MSGATMRAKFKVDSVNRQSPTQEDLVMSAVCPSSFGPEGEHEDNVFARYTPCGGLTMTIQNPDLIGKIKEGEEYYIDFTLAPKKEPEESEG